MRNYSENQMCADISVSFEAFRAKAAMLAEHEWSQDSAQSTYVDSSEIVPESFAPTVPAPAIPSPSDVYGAEAIPCAPTMPCKAAA